MRAIKVQPESKAGVEEVPVPKLRPTYGSREKSQTKAHFWGIVSVSQTTNTILGSTLSHLARVVAEGTDTHLVLVKTAAVALNPTDWKHVDGRGEPGTTLGCDWAGEVVEIGSGVTKALKKGDRVAGFTHGANANEPEDGAFGEYLVSKGDCVMKIPDWMTFGDASTYGVAVITCGQFMYQHMKLPHPPSGPSKQSILIYGGSTATGMLAIQYARLSGLDVLATCSPRNFDLVKSLGATAAYDYKSPTCAADIRRDTGNGLLYAFDCISEGSSSSTCAEALSSESSGQPPVLGTILHVPQAPRADIKMIYSLGYTFTGESFRFKGPPGKPGLEFLASSEDFAFAKEWYDLSEKLIAKRQLKPLRTSLREGLENVLEGVEDVRQGRVSGEKIVYTIG